MSCLFDSDRLATAGGRTGVFDGDSQPVSVFDYRQGGKNDRDGAAKQ